MSKNDTVSGGPMKKVERINIIMRYINNRAHFTISEIMREFNISRSTAIRDIREIEAMGMPLVTEVGRGGFSWLDMTQLRQKDLQISCFSWIGNGMGFFLL